MKQKVVYIGLDLLDRQLLDRDKQRCGKVDDLELSVPDGAPEGSAPVITAILTGPGALTSRLWGWPGGVARFLWRRISPDPTRPRGKLQFEAVERLHYDVHLNVRADQAGLHDRERWALRLIGGKPGSHDES
jgi:hypothetical protein